MSPELSYDGQQALFAYSPIGPNRHEKRFYHIFRANLDGSGLRQLTAGTCDDVDPCWLPDGRIVFVSTGRGAFVRCGSQFPVTTLHRMNADGSDLQPISYHELTEWLPSVANDGRLVYTRWDYIDRDPQIAAHLWLSLPDGRNPRSPHANYPLAATGSNLQRPHSEMHIRAVPGSQRFVATAGAHHGPPFGPLVLIDLHLPDDGWTSQLRYLTPDVLSGEGHHGLGLDGYGMPWPLSEDYYLCAYRSRALHPGVPNLWLVPRGRLREHGTAVPGQPGLCDSDSDPAQAPAAGDSRVIQCGGFLMLPAQRL